MKDFKYSMHAQVSLALSSEAGVVRARAEYFTGNRCYLVAYKAADGRQVDAWVDEDLLNEG